MNKNYFLFALIFSLFTLAGIAQAPVINNMNGNSVVCTGTAAYNVSASGNPTSYNWSVSPANSVTISTPGNDSTIIGYPNIDANYTVTCQAFNASGASNVMTMYVTIFEKPDVTFSGKAFVCQGSSTNLSASPTISSGGNTLFYMWSPGTTPVNGPNVAVNPNVTTTYTAYVFNGACMYEFPVTVYVNSFGFSGNTLICENASTDITAGGNSPASSSMYYNWVPAYGLNTTTGPMVTANPAVTTVYTVTIVDGPCVLTNTVAIMVDACTGIGEQNREVKDVVIYPNPNNGKFVLRSASDGTGTVIDELGRTIWQIKFVRGEETEIEGLNSGVYFILTPLSKTKIVVIR